MGLDLYRKKRDFKKTPEPPPKQVAKKGFSFCVQKHDATRLHYDFRLELDGVLKSWAVTRGPSIDPADKRLAVRTEDHPVSYGDFEGVIPQGEYGGGTVMLWDRGNWTPIGDPRAGLKKGRLEFELHGERLCGRWILIRMRNRKESDKNENWLLIKEKDKESKTGKKSSGFLDENDSSIKTGRGLEDIATGKGKKKILAAPSKKPIKKKINKDWMDDYQSVQLATLVDAAPAGAGWIHEVKFDGYRILCLINEGGVVIKTRNGNDWTDRFPSLIRQLAKLKVKQAVLDGEAVVVNEKGITGFQDLQETLSEGGDAERIQAYFFDLLHLNGKDLRKETLLDRKKALAKILPSSKKSVLHYSDHFEGNDEILSHACDIGLEGIISKKKTASYAEGRSKTWLKSKCGKRQEFVIVGYTKSKSGPRAIGALHIAYYDKKVLTYAGKVGTGFTHKMAEDMLTLLKSSAVADAPVSRIPAAAKRGTIWVEPVHMCEVAFTEWTKDGHVRHPSFQGLREDKKPKQISREKPQKIMTKTSTGPMFEGITITHPEREVYKDNHVTKLDIAAYYNAVAPYMLREIKGRPISLLRCPSGVDGSCFFQRNPDKSMKEDVKPFTFHHKGKKYEYIYIDNEKGLLFLAQMGVIEIHPWGSTVKRIDYPTRIIFDLDPDEGVPFDAVRLAAFDIRARLKKLGLESFPKCTGGKGLHVVVPLDGKNKWPKVKAFAEKFADGMVAAVPDAYVATMSKAKRKGKIFIDFFRNDYTATAIADYSLRARPGAHVAVPLRWEELKVLKSAHEFTMEDVLKRLKKKNPDDGRHELKQSLPKL